MQYSGELTVGAIGIIVSILATGIGGISTALAIFVKMRGDITKLEINHLGLKSDIAELKGENKAIIATLQTNTLHLERISTRQELMGAITNLPNDLASAITKLQQKEKGQ